MNLSENTVARCGVIYVSSKENGILFFNNLAGVVTNQCEIALYSVETSQITQFHQQVSISCNALTTSTEDGLGVLRYFFVTPAKTRCTTNFNKLYFKPIDQTLQRIYFECPNSAISLEYIVIIHRLKKKLNSHE